MNSEFARKDRELQSAAPQQYEAQLQAYNEATKPFRRLEGDVIDDTEFAMLGRGEYEVTLGLRKHRTQRIWMLCNGVAIVALISCLCLQLIDNRFLNRKVRFLSASPEEANDRLSFKIKEVSFSASQKSNRGKANLEIQNESQLGCKIVWRTDTEHNFRIFEERKQQNDRLPIADPVEIVCLPFHNSYWVQPFSVTIIDEKGSVQYLGIKTGKALIAPKDGDKVVVKLLPPIPPWNAVLIRVKSDFALVTLDLPMSDQQPRKEELGADPKYPNCPSYWAHFGDKGMAASLARRFVIDRTARSDHNAQFTDQRSHSTLIVPGSKDRLCHTFDTITEVELREHLVKAFLILKGKENSAGRSIENEIALAGQDSPSRE